MIRTGMVVVALATALTGCGGQAEESDRGPQCTPTPEAGAAIEEGLTVTGGGSLRNPMAMALPAPEEGPLTFGYVVAAEIDGPGIEGEGEIGTWAVGELGGGPIFAANQVAQEFSEWGAEAQEGSPADAARDAVAQSDQASAAEECVRRAS